MSTASAFEAAADKKGQAPGLAKMLAVPYGLIPPEEVEPLWPGWIPRRHVTLVVAPGGTSKGLWSVDVIARVTTGRPWPGEPVTAVREPEAVILVAPEDDPNEAVAYRLKAAGADASLVFNLTILPDGAQFMMSDLDVLTEAVEQVEQVTGRTVGLVVLDPLLALVPVKLPGRKEIAPVEAWARAHGPAVVVCHHTVKSGKVAGLMELTNAVRHVLRIDRIAGADKGSPVREVTVGKSNMGSDGASIRYVLTGDGSDVHVVYPADDASAPVSRGYTIAPAKPAGKASSLGSQAKLAGCRHSHTRFGTPEQCWDCPAAKLLKPQKAVTASWQLLFCESGGTPAALGKDFASDSDAKAAAAVHAGHALPWRQGDHGSLMAATLAKGGKPAAYTVFPNGG